jgi:hypothetical protein
MALETLVADGDWDDYISYGISDIEHAANRSSEFVVPATRDLRIVEKSLFELGKYEIAEAAGKIIVRNEIEDWEI